MQKYLNFSDAELAALLKKGDRDAYSAIYERFFSVLYLHAKNRLKNKDEAKDTIQNIFIKLWNIRDSASFTNLSNYLYTAVRNEVMNIVSHKAVESKYLSTLPQSIVMSDCITDYRLRERQLTDIINKEIEQLPPKMRAVFQLSRVRNLSHKEIAERLAISEQSVRSHIKNALKILRSRLGIVFFIAL